MSLDWIDFKERKPAVGQMILAVVVYGLQRRVCPIGKTILVSGEYTGEDYWVIDVAGVGGYEYGPEFSEGEIVSWVPWSAVLPD